MKDTLGNRDKKKQFGLPRSDDPPWPGDTIKLPGEVIEEDGADDGREPEPTIIPVIR